MKETAVKMLFAFSGNRCAFPRCENRLIERGVVVGEMCHIEAKEAGGPRYNEHQTKEEREVFENFILMCAIHHKVIDTKPDEYPVPLLQDWKAKHEGRVTAGASVSRRPLTADQVHQFMQTTNIVHAVTSINQQGGQTAYHITNVYHETVKAPQPDRLTASLRADLSAKLARAQELDARDDHKQAIDLIEEVYHTARSHGFGQEQLEATLHLGLATSNKHDFKTVDRRFREAEKLIRGVKSPWLQIQFYRLKAKVLLHKNKFKAGEKVLEKALTLSQSSDAGCAEAGLLSRASYIHLLCDKKRVDEASEHVLPAREVVEGAESNHPIALIAELLEACIHWAISKDDIQEVKAFVNAALRHGAGSEAAICIGHTLHDCANGARGMKATDAAVICADAATRLGHVAQRPDIALMAAYTAAGALAEKKDFQEARKRCLDLVDAAKSVDEPTLRFLVFQLLSQTSQQLGDKITAVDAATTALQATKGVGIELCLAKMTLAEALRDSGRVKEAMEHARTAYQLSEHCDLPSEWVDDVLVLIADCAARLGDWATAESFSVEIGERSRATPGSKDRRKMIENRIHMHKMIRDSLASVVSASAPLSVAKTEGADSVQTANAMLMSSVIDAWKDYPNAASAIYDYWGRGNFLRAMLNMRAFPGTFNITLEVHTIEEARQAVRLWALISDVLVLIWKGPTVSSRVMCPVPAESNSAGGGGYFVFPTKGIPLAPAELTGLGSLTGRSKDGWGPVVYTEHASLLPADVGRFLCDEAATLISLGRLIMVPSTGICCIGTGHGPIESLFAEACNAMPAIRGDAARFPASWVPYFPDIPLVALAEVVQEQEVSIRRLRLLLMRRTRQFITTGITGGEAKELELEIQDSLAHVNETQAGLRRRHGWGEAREALASRYDGFTEHEVAPILLMQNMGYRWRVEHAIGGSSPRPALFPKKNEPIGTWLHPPGTNPKIVTLNTDAAAHSNARRKRK